MPGWRALGRAVRPKCMSSPCSWCGQCSSSSPAAPLPRSSTCWLACSSPALLSAPVGAKPRCGSWLSDLPALPRPLSRQVPCHPSGLSALQRVRGTRQPCSIFRLWRIPLGSPFRAEKVSHCEGEAKTRIRPTDPALTCVHRSKLAGLQRFGGREVAAGARREAAKGAASRSETQRRALGMGRTPPSPGWRAALWVFLSHQRQMGQ